MKNKTKFLAVIALAIACLFSTHQVQAQLFDQNVTAIFGSGNPNTGWTTDSADGITLALRAKNRENSSTANVNGVYSEPVGYQQPANNRARWNWEFSINSGAVNLDAYDYYIGVDTDPSVGVSHLILDALGFPDNSYGNDTTLNGAGVEGLSSTYASIYNISQQSWNLTFYGGDPTLHATYDYELYAVAKGAGANGDKIATVEITVVVGDGGQTAQQLIDDLALTATNHGEYVVAVNVLTKYLQDGGAINKKQRQEFLKAAAQASVGQ